MGGENGGAKVQDNTQTVNSAKISLKQLLCENFAPPDVPGMIIYDICLDTFCFPSVSEITKRIDWQRCLFIENQLLQLGHGACSPQIGW